MITTNSLFGQILQIIDFNDFQHLVNVMDADKFSKGFSCKEQLVAMLFCHFAHAKSLREICYGLHTCLGKISHLGIEEAPKRSTLSYANAHRPWQLYQSLFLQTLETCYRKAPGKKKKFRFKNKLFSFDSSLIELCLSLFPWAEYRQTKGAVKLHVLLDHEGYFPVFAHITEGREHEVNTLHWAPIPQNSIVVFDRGFIDYVLFDRYTREGVFFVTRMKSNAQYKVLERHPVDSEAGVICDQIIEWTGYKSRLECPGRLRRVKIRAEVDGETKILTFVTNHFDLSAKTIGQIYRDRWEIEIFFKILKQNLKVKTFVGTSRNALQIQIWTALIAHLLLKYMQFTSGCEWAISNLMALLRLNLFTYRDLWAWLKTPLTTPPIVPVDGQLKLFGTAF